jgi:hypothetical protein
MADIKFPCPRCGTTIECDELWCGHQLQCPACQGEMVVPPKPELTPAAPAAGSPQVNLSGLSKAAASAPKLSIGGAASHARPSAAPAPSPQSTAFERKMIQARAAKEKGKATKWIVIGAVVVICAIGGYFGYGYYNEWQAKRAEAAKPAAPPVPTNAPAEPPQELAVIPPLWTLNVDEAKIPNGKANGMLAGTNFLVESAQFDQAKGTYLLRLDEGNSTAPALQVKIYLTLGPTESPTGHVWSVSQDMKGKGVPQIIKLWKPNPKFAAQQKLFNTGYAMKLELGDITNGTIFGKIFLALPDKEESVVGGIFKAATALTGAPAGVTPAAAAVPTAASAAQRAAMDQRYGKKK